VFDYLQRQGFPRGTQFPPSPSRRRAPRLPYRLGWWGRFPHSLSPRRHSTVGRRGHRHALAGLWLRVAGCARPAASLGSRLCVCNLHRALFSEPPGIQRFCGCPETRHARSAHLSVPFVRCVLWLTIQSCRRWRPRTHGLELHGRQKRAARRRRRSCGRLKLVLCATVDRYVNDCLGECSIVVGKKRHLIYYKNKI
jgi:hypothetical protein